jgi:hypothetical protein
LQLKWYENDAESGGIERALGKNTYKSIANFDSSKNYLLVF